MTDERGERVAAEVARLQGEEAHKRMLYDRTIGGPMVPRPTEQFIRDNAGPLKNENQIRDEAGKRVDAQRDQERQIAQNRAEVDRSLRQHDAAVARERQQADRGGDRGAMPQGNRDHLRQDREGRDGSSARERLRGEGREGQSRQFGKSGQDRSGGIDR